MKKIFAVGFAAAMAVAGSSAFGAGFGIYEASSRGNGMAGALVGGTGDATAVYYNPAALTDVTNVSVSAGVTFINPFCDVTVNHQPQTKMNSGWFTAPNFYLSVPLTDRIVVGYGNYSEFGLGTKYGQHWAMAGDTIDTTIIQYTFNPVLAVKLTDWWSVAAGARISYIDFENHKRPMWGPSAGVLTANAKSRLHGDDINAGWLVANNFKITDKLKLGVMYRSRINHVIKGDFNVNGGIYSPLGLAVPMYAHSPAKAKLTLPQSLTVGLNYDITDDWRVGVTAMAIGWRSVDKINFKIPAVVAGQKAGYVQKLNWKDTFRLGFGTEYDINDWLTARCGYTYDQDPTTEKYGTTMLPSGDRHIVHTGLGFNLAEGLRLDVGYSLVLMERGSRYITVKDLTDGTRYHFDCRNSYSHLVSAQLTYNF
ncbi:MAG: outer membrane protein transport protein [Kiritimatiellae bacterium]|nr:outer membrane protein transport protein [Kiritimatiellia bacterium]